METLIKLSSYIKPYKKKERFETILEPLQALTQLALLSYCPVGTKLSVSNNLLTIQSLSWNQSFIRSYNSDTRDDIFFLFSVIQRYNKFYSYFKTKGGIYSELFHTMIELSNNGIDNLILTYSNTNQHQLLHTLRIYKVLLTKPDAFIVEENKIINNSTKKTSTSSSMFKPEILDENVNLKVNENIDNIDEIFIKITKIYTDSHIQLLYNIFNILRDDSVNYETYIKSINTIFNPINENIKKWISENIIF